MTQARNPAAYHDHRRVEHVDGRGQRLADRPPRLTNGRESAVVATPRGIPDIFHGELALLLQEDHEGRGFTFPSAPFRLQHYRRGRRHRLQAAGVSARAEGPLGIHADVAEVPGAALSATVEAAADDDPAAYSRTDLDEDHVGDALRHPAPMLAERHHIHVVVYEDRGSVLPGERLA